MKLLNYFRMLRVKSWIKAIFWVPFIGVILVRASFKTLILVGVIYFCVISYSFVINNYFDVEIDKKHKGKIKTNTNPLAQGLVTKRGTLMLLGILLSIPLALSIQVSFIGFIFVLLSILAPTLYSIKYVRLKERPVIDIATHGFTFGLFFLAGVTLAGGNLNFPIILIGILFMILGINSLLAHQAADYTEDLGNTETFAIKIGRKMSYLCLILGIMASLLCFEVILRFFTVEWWLHYSIFMFLVFCFPLRYLKEIKNKFRVQLLSSLFKV